MSRKILVFFLLLGTVPLAYAQKKDKKNKQAETETKINYKEIGSPLPPVKVITIDKQTITEKDLKNKFNLFVVLFNPLCDHCQTLMVEMGKHVDEFPKNKVVFMAEKSMIDHLEFFKNVTRYTDYPHIMVGADSANFTGNAFIYQSMPQVNIYDKDRKLVKIFSGLTTTDSLKQYFK